MLTIVGSAAFLGVVAPSSRLLPGLIPAWPSVVVWQRWITFLPVVLASEVLVWVRFVEPCLIRFDMFQLVRFPSLVVDHEFLHRFHGCTNFGVASIDENPPGLVTPTSVSHQALQYFDLLGKCTSIYVSSKITSRERVAT